MYYAAKCGHLEAAVEVARFELELAEEAGWKPTTTMAWLWHLHDLGYDTSDEIVRLSTEHGLSASRDSYQNLISIIENTPPDCRR
jgi:hypothetical protein